MVTRNSCYEFPLVRRDTEKYVSDLRKIEQLKNECEKEKEELRNAAQDTIRQ